ncbi:ribose-5-phosphate isomerase [Mycolicibacterium novocastrense]|uniref:RpiB/LacA/LacB family sugar-phosphate isomerase n=1 Tax=Mycolicibacterium novocastrense TaxID=59813 RepID=UPI0007494619|nr:RpiB/LacA/LacB family sugar-phosphate isomerase [Mycolicibacterium novocastrense]KUH69828.1 ribose-5-phosphate isomerase [Mycolicibacterium novocastrense]KUH71377.1 ribose-5-phosphate isomerase [Mycolicibacterium novocastrense]KUH74441.1 ribose-5-phosphate isomerase [Mycolicibacterium novocastrense]
MRIYLGADRAGLKVENRVTAHLGARGYEVVHCGADPSDEIDDYPAFCIDTALQTANDLGSLGILLGDNGNDEQIAANKAVGARCALAWNPETARLARARLDAQLIGIGVQMHTTEEVLAIVDAFITTPWSVEEHYFHRIHLIRQYDYARMALRPNSFAAAVHAEEGAQ